MSGGTMAKLTMPLCPNCGIVTMRTPCPFCEQIAHAVALEREAIAAWLETAAPSVNPKAKPVKPARDESRRFIREAEVLQRAAQSIRRGAHNARGEGEGT